MKASFLLVSLGALLSFNQAFAINHYKEFSDGQWAFDATAYYLRTNSNFANDGSKADFAQSNYFQVLDTQLGTRWGLSEQLNLYAYGNIGSAESKGVDATRSNSTFNRVIMGGELLIDVGGFQLVPEFDVNYNLEKVSNTQDVAINSDGSNAFTGRLNVQLDFSGFLVFGYAGFTYRDNGRSNLVPWGVNAEYAAEQFHVGGEIFGFQSITDDKDKGTTNEALRTAVLARVNGGSARYYSINPSVIDSNVYMKFAVNRKWNLWAGAGMTFAGSNYSNGFHFEGGVRYILGGEADESYYRRQEEIEKISTDRKVEKFREDTSDGVDQRMFRPTPTPPPPKPVVKARKATVSERQVRDQMDDVEMQIELKSNKKRRKK